MYINEWLWNKLTLGRITNCGKVLLWWKLWIINIKKGLIIIQIFVNPYTYLETVPTFLVFNISKWYYGLPFNLTTSCHIFNILYMHSIFHYFIFHVDYFVIHSIFLVYFIYLFIFIRMETLPTIAINWLLLT